MQVNIVNVSHCFDENHREIYFSKSKNVFFHPFLIGKCQFYVPFIFFFTFLGSPVPYIEYETYLLVRKG